MRVLLFAALVLMAACEIGEKADDREGPPDIVYGEVFVGPEGDDYGPGTREQPWDHLAVAISRLGPGAILTILEGTYQYSRMIRVDVQGTADSSILIRGEPGKNVVIDFSRADIGNSGAYPYTQGAIQVSFASHVQFRDLKILNSHVAGFNISYSDHISLINCETENTFSSGIAAWQDCSHITVMGNTVINANDPDMVWGGNFTGREPPHEALSMAGPHFFEVAYNLVRDCQKEGIDVKETASYGLVHHNHVHHCDRQALYIDAWFGVLEDIQMYDNVAHHCEAGIAVSCEDGPLARDLHIHRNLVYDNRATGLFFSRWGKDLLRKNVHICNNTFYRNGCGAGDQPDPDYWLTGGLYLFTIHLEEVIIRNNIFSLNSPFEIGRSQDYGEEGLEERNILIDYNLIHDVNTVPDPFYMATWTRDSVYSITGDPVIEDDPLFVDASGGDFRLQAASPAIDAGHPEALYNDPDGSRNDIGAFPHGTGIDDFWWKSGFPPRIDDPEEWSHATW
jgi:hypothetical protein